MSTSLTYNIWYAFLGAENRRMMLTQFRE